MLESLDDELSKQASECGLPWIHIIQRMQCIWRYRARLQRSCGAVDGRPVALVISNNCYLWLELLITCTNLGGSVEFVLAAVVDKAAGTAGASLYWWLDIVEIDGEHRDFSSSDTVAQPRWDDSWLRQTSSTMLSSPPCPRSCHLRVVCWFFVDVSFNNVQECFSVTLVLQTYCQEHVLCLSTNAAHHPLSLN